MAVQLISRVRDVFGVDVPVGEFLRSPTIMAMAEAVALGQAQSGKIPGVEELLSEIEALGAKEAGALLARSLKFLNGKKRLSRPQWHATAWEWYNSIGRVQPFLFLRRRIRVPE